MDYFLKQLFQNPNSLKLGRTKNIYIMNYGLDSQGIRVSFLASETDFSSSPQCPNQLWSLPSLPSNGHWGLFPQG
jgi:hypothetical protein